MSAYMSFFVRSYSDELMPIGTFSRSHDIYQAFVDRVPYEKLVAIDKELLSLVRFDIEGNKDSIKTLLEREESKQMFLTAAHPLSDKSMELLEDILDTKEQLVESLKELEVVEMFINTLEYMIEDMYDIEHYTSEGKFVPSDKYLYVGIEVGYHPELPQEENDG